ncbi:MAG: choice-of-anchor V domain-containing protein [Candidatus Kapaibacteriota bacterium]
MKKALSILVLSGFFIASIVQADLTGILSFGAPPSSTGAPGEITCAESGCHDDSPVPMRNSSHGLTLHSKGGSIQAGDSTMIIVQVADSNVLRFGFQLTALDAHGKSSGTFLISDPEHTQLIHNHVSFTDRAYVTYTKEGTLAKNIGHNQWKCMWVAPKDHQGPISFYLATVSANNDNRDKGDKVFLMDTTIYLQGATGIREAQSQCILRGQTIHVFNQSSILSFNIIALDGSIIESHDAHTGETLLDISRLPKGFYVLQSQFNSFPFIR